MDLSHSQNPGSTHPISPSGGNPFHLDVCSAPFSVVESQTVSGLNQAALSLVGEAIEDLGEGQGASRTGNPLLLLTAPRAGYGKTHLLGRIVAQTEGQAVAMPLIFRPDNDLTWSALASESISALAQLPSHAHGWSRLREACAGIFASLVRRMVSEGLLPCANRAQAERVLAADPKALFSETSSARIIGDWLRKNYGQIRKGLADRAKVPVGTTSPAEIWVDAFFACAQHGSAATIATVTSMASTDRIAFTTWLQFVANWRPLVLLVDHLDGFYRDEQAGLRIANMVLELASLEGASLVLSMNQDLWQGTFANHLPSALEDRLTASPFLLRGLNEEEARDLTELRLKLAHVPDSEVDEFISFLRLNRYFQTRPAGSVSVRAYLRHVADEWVGFQEIKARGETPRPEPDPEDIPPPIPTATAPLPLTIPESPDEEEEAVPAIFPLVDTEAIKKIADSLKEPTPAMVTQTFAMAPLSVEQGGSMQSPPSVTSPPPEPPPSPFLLADDPSTDIAEPTHTPPQQPQAPGAMEKLRDMMDRLRQLPNQSPPEGTQANGTGVAARLANVMEPGTSAQDRFEALKAEAASVIGTSHSLDYSRIGDVVRLAGKRFPLVRYDELALPGLANRSIARWTLPGMEILFGLGALVDMGYWKSVIDLAGHRLSQFKQEAGDTPPNTRIKILVPKSEHDTLAWTSLLSSQVLPEHLRAYLDPLHLDPRSLASLYATQSLIHEAENGSLQVSPPHLMSIVTKELDFLWKRVTRTPLQYS
ncbi:MAG: hypothetical protein JNJ83_13195 [Verrucomicrobiaceae bacterium]|nr:hypothetical protein [Verrucomicrobiaceae bacterium]